MPINYSQPAKLVVETERSPGLSRLKSLQIGVHGENRR